MITNSLDEYKSLAINLARNPQKLTEIKKKLIINKDKTPLFDTKNYTKNLEAAYKSVYKKYNENNTFDDIII